MVRDTAGTFNLRNLRRVPRRIRSAGASLRPRCGCPHGEGIGAFGRAATDRESRRNSGQTSRLEPSLGLLSMLFLRAERLCQMPRMLFRDPRVNGYGITSKNAIFSYDSAST